MESASLVADAEYILPLKWADDDGLENLAAYLGELVEWLPVTVIDGSAPERFAAHAAAFPARVRHLVPELEGLRNGKVAGVLTGVRHATAERLVIADDDVRYSRKALARVVAGLDRADVVRPQNYFAGPPTWHVRWDTARSLINRAFGSDYPGTLAVRRSTLERAGGYDGNVLFENLELVRTVRAVGGAELRADDLFVPRLPCSERHFLDQRVRQAYDSLAQPARLAAELALLPAVVASARRPRRLLALATAAVAAAERGRRRAGGRHIYPHTAALWAPAWLAERAVCSWLALYWRLRGGVPYAGGRLLVAGHSVRRLRRRLGYRPEAPKRGSPGPVASGSTTRGADDARPGAATIHPAGDPTETNSIQTGPTATPAPPTPAPPKPTTSGRLVTVPKLRTFDSTAAFLREGYPFISARCDELGTDAFRTRIAGRPVLCMRGAEAAQVFYDDGRFSRRGALPPTVVHLLQDKGSVQTLEGAEHSHRKAMFLALMGEDSVTRLREAFSRAWKQRADGWAGRRVVLHGEAHRILTAAAAEWAGVPLDDREVEARAREFALMVNQAGSFGPKNWWAQLRRRRTEKWARGIIEDLRAGRRHAPAGTPVAVIAAQQDRGGTELPAEVAAVELLNVLRPIVAVARFIVFAGTALTEHPAWAERFASGDPAKLQDLEPFAQEVRRYYPFFPAVAGTATTTFSWGGHTFKPGSWVMLDLYGTNHDARLWPDPEAFRPERFRGWDDNPYRLVPQGGGRVESSHRCPGERITLELVKEAVRLLAAGGHSVPAQDLTVPLNQLPSMTRSGLILQGALHR